MRSSFGESWVNQNIFRSLFFSIPSSPVLILWEGIKQMLGRAGHGQSCAHPNTAPWGIFHCSPALLHGECMWNSFLSLSTEVFGNTPLCQDRQRSVHLSKIIGGRGHLQQAAESNSSWNLMWDLMWDLMDSFLHVCICAGRDWRGLGCVGHAGTRRSSSAVSAPAGDPVIREPWPSWPVVEETALCLYCGRGHLWMESCRLCISIMLLAEDGENRPFRCK